MKEKDLILKTLALSHCKDYLILEIYFMLTTYVEVGQIQINHLFPFHKKCPFALTEVHNYIPSFLSRDLVYT